MLLNEPPVSQYDLRFDFLGIPIRVSWTFWLAALIFGYGAAQQIDYLFLDSSPGMAPWLLLWVGVMFASILIHEMGHALAFQYCGIHSTVVLYHFGGLAIPTSGRAPGLSASRLGRYENIFIAAAGPVAQLFLALATLLALRFVGYDLVGGDEKQLFEFGRGAIAGPTFLRDIPGFAGGKPITTPGLYAFVDFMLFVNIWWPMLNLVPVWPLDGGRIARELICIFGGTTYLANQVSMIAAGSIALLMFKWQQPFAAFLFISLAVGSYQLLNSSSQWRM